MPLKLGQVPTLSDCNRQQLLWLWVSAKGCTMRPAV